MRNRPLPLERPWYKTISQPVSILINTRLMGHLEFQVMQKKKKSVKRASHLQLERQTQATWNQATLADQGGRLRSGGGGGTWETPAAFTVYFSTQACPSLGQSHTELELWAAPTDSRTRIWGKFHAIVQVLFAAEAKVGSGLPSASLFSAVYSAVGWGGEHRGRKDTDVRERGHSTGRGVPGSSMCVSRG